MFRKKITLIVLSLCIILMQESKTFAWYDYCDECCCERFWFDADYLYWKIKKAPEHVPLVVEGPFVESGPVLKQPGYSVVLGGKSLKTDWRSGGRFTLGYWFDDSQCLGGEVGYFILPSKSKRHSVCSNGSPFLTLPYYDVVTGEENSSPLSSPDPTNPFAGTGRLKEHNFMQGAEVNLVTSTACDCCFRYGLLAGFRYWNFTEKLTFDTNSPGIDTPDVFKTQDRFHAQNNFYGGQFGARLDYNACNFFFNIKGKVALGAMCQKLGIHGQFITDTLNSELQKFNQGFFALPTNIGNHKKTRFSVIPEVNINLGYQVTECFRLKLGYTFIYATNVLWAGKQIDRKINPTQSIVLKNNSDVHLVGDPSPKASLKSESLWVQGLNVGLEFNF